MNKTLNGTKRQMNMNVRSKTVDKFSKTAGKLGRTNSVGFLQYEMYLFNYKI